MSDLQVQQVKEKLDIVEVVSGYLKLERTGINLRTCCPFHQEKKPSFFVSPARQSFKCFGCNAGGDIFEFVMKIEGVEFGDALRILAKRAGVELQSFSQQDKQLKTKRNCLYEILEIATKFFETQLEKTKTGQLAKEYLLGRGLTNETIKKFRLGWAPFPQGNNWRALSDFLVSRGYQREDVVASGLAIASEKAQTPYDRFRGRIMFPVFDINSQVVGFGGRIFNHPSLPKQEEIAKYINIQNTLLYDKSRIIYGLNLAKMAIRQKDFAILTEGYMDVILSHQHGFENTVAVSGTALTPLHLKTLQRYTNNLYTAFDMDKAGGMATKRSIDLIQTSGLEVKVITMEKEKDPADIIKENPAQWQKELDGAKDIMDFYFQDACDKFNVNEAKGKQGIAGSLLPEIKKIQSKIVQTHFLQRLANLLKVSEEAVVEELKKITIHKPENQYNANYAQTQSVESKPNKKSRQQMLEEKAIALAISAPERFGYIAEDDHFCFSKQGQWLVVFCKKIKEPTKQTMSEALEQLAKDDLTAKPFVDECLFKADILDDDDPEYEFQVCLCELRDLNKKAKLGQLAKELETAELSGDEEKTQQLSQQFNSIAHIPSSKK